MKSSEEKMMGCEPLVKPISRPVAPPKEPAPVNPTGTVVQGPDGKWETRIPQTLGGPRI